MLRRAFPRVATGWNREAYSPVFCNLVSDIVDNFRVGAGIGTGIRIGIGIRGVHRAGAARLGPARTSQAGPPNCRTVSP